ncbi:MAG TPA: hypothetical protein VHL59_06100, partial [Thermoanaerobaculia bacterium]|nr:hypothetical protein [Thermoanaerobaculia bacterium]
AGWKAGCTPEFEVLAGESGYPQVAMLQPAQPSSVAWGTVRLADGSAATLVDRSSDAEDVPSVEVIDASGNAIVRGRTNAAGQFAIGVSRVAAGVRVASAASRQELRFAPRAAGAAAAAVVVTLQNRRPAIGGVQLLVGGAVPRSVNPGDVVTLRPQVTDADGDALQFDWTANAGTITAAADGTASWQLPAFPARLRAYLIVRDGKGGSDRRVVSVNVGAAAPSVTVAAPGAPPTCNPLSLAAVPPPSGYPPTPPFLTFMGTTDNSAKYYANVDPRGLRKTLGAWWRVAGFNPSDGSGGVARAAYLNWNDLGFGRDMHFNQVGRNVYAWVTNYGCPDNNPRNADLAARPVPANAVATVCMEYAPVEGQTQPIVKFFVYVGGVASSPITGKADLDEWGAKPVPNLCQVCHGGQAPYSGGTNVNLGSSFIPFDLALLRFPGPSVTPPPADLAQYHKMNRIIADSTGANAAIVNLVNGWYTPLLSPPSQNNNYLPAGWKASGTVPATAAILYQNVLVPGCRSCHYSFSSSISWDTYQSAVNNRSSIQPLVCGKGPFMPHAAVTYINFWTNAYRFRDSPPYVLGIYRDANWTSFGGCTGR